MRKIIVLSALILSMVIPAASSAAFTTGSWNYMPTTDISFQGDCSYNTSNNMLVCDADQVMGPAYTAPWRTSSGNCIITIRPSTPSGPAHAHMVCTPTA